jgi:hypothetical protein
MPATIDKKELWVQWTHDAITKYIPPDGKIDTEELVEDMVEVTTGYADSMLEEFRESIRRRTETSSKKRAR